VRTFWERFFSSSPDSRFTAEEIFTSGDRCVVRWRYDWRSIDGTPGHIRGVDFFRVRGGKVAEKFACVKGYSFLYIAERIENFLGPAA
jgi:ketosteroid isomerase-like protein